MGTTCGGRKSPDPAFLGLDMVLTHAPRREQPEHALFNRPAHLVGQTRGPSRATGHGRPSSGESVTFDPRAAGARGADARWLWQVMPLARLSRHAPGRGAGATRCAGVRRPGTGRMVSTHAPGCWRPVTQRRVVAQAGGKHGVPRGGALTEATSEDRVGREAPGEHDFPPGSATTGLRPGPSKAADIGEQCRDGAFPEAHGVDLTSLNNLT